MKTGSRAVHPVAKPAEALQLAKHSLDHVTLPLQLGVQGLQLTDGLLSRDAGPRRDERPEPALRYEAVATQAVVALVSQECRLGGLRRVGQDLAQDRQRCAAVGQGQEPERCVVIAARKDADGEGIPVQFTGSDGLVPMVRCSPDWPVCSANP